MTAYTLPAPPDGPVWLADHPEHGGPLRFDPCPDKGCENWIDRVHDIELGWPELLALGDVDDEYPGPWDLHDTATPWRAEGNKLYGADGERVGELYGTSTATASDEALARLVVELVNRHAAPAETAAAEVVDKAADRLALAVNELVLYVRGLPTAALNNLGRGWPELAKHVNAVGAAHAAVR